MLNPDLDRQGESSGVFNSAHSEGRGEQHPPSIAYIASSGTVSSAPWSASSGTNPPHHTPTRAHEPERVGGEGQERDVPRAPLPASSGNGTPIRGNEPSNHIDPSGGGTAAVRHTDYLGNFIRDPQQRRAAVAMAQGPDGADHQRERSESFDLGLEKPPRQASGQPLMSSPLYVGVVAAQPATTMAAAVAATATADGTPLGGPLSEHSSPLQQQRSVSFTPSGTPHEPPHTPPSLNARRQEPQAGNNSHDGSGGASSKYKNTTSPMATFNTAGGANVVIDNSGYINVDDIPVRLATMGRRDRPWHYGLCECCHDCSSCLESWCCLPCQVSRQCNMLMNDKPKIHWPFCILIVSTECLTGCTLVACLFTGQARRMARERYGIAGSGIGDCCAGFWCRCCTLQQVLLEMSIMNDFPGAICYSVDPTPRPQSDVEMR